MNLRCFTKSAILQIHVLQCNCSATVVKIDEMERRRRSYCCSYLACNFTKLYTCLSNFQRFWLRWLLVKMQKKLFLPVTFNETLFSEEPKAAVERNIYIYILYIYICIYVYIYMYVFLKKYIYKKYIYI